MADQVLTDSEFCIWLGLCGLVDEVEGILCVTAAEVVPVPVSGAKGAK